MKIAVVYDMLYPYNKGGVEVRNHDVAVELKKLGHDVTLFGTKLWEGEDEIEYEGIKLVGVCRYGKGNFSGRRKFWEPLNYSVRLLPKLLKEDFDLIDCCAFPYFPAFSCKITSILKGVPLTITWHMWWGSWWLKYKGPPIGSVGYIIEWMTKHLSKNNITVSENIKKEGKIRNAQVIANGVDIEKIKRIKQSAEKSDVIYAGHLVEGKNVDLLIKAIASMREKLKTLIVGDGPLRSELEELSKKLGTQDSIKFLGEVENEEVISLMKSSQVFASASTQEGFGLAVLEAMACGLTPVVVGDKMNASADLVSASGVGIASDGTVEGLGDAINYMLSNNEKKKTMSKNANIFANELSLENQTNKLALFYRSIIH